MVAALAGFPDNVLAFSSQGRVTKADYDDILIPAVRSILQRHRKVRLYYETEGDVVSIEPSAIWEDVTLGLKSITHWERIAIVTDIERLVRAGLFFGSLMPWPMRCFPKTEAAQARAWISAG
jgi:hypothetical protein